MENSNCYTSLRYLDIIDIVYSVEPWSRVSFSSNSLFHPLAPPPLLPPHTHKEKHFLRRSCDTTTTVKALVNEDTLLGTHCCLWCFLGCANWETFVADTFVADSTLPSSAPPFFASLPPPLPPPLYTPATQAIGVRRLSATICLQQCVLVCQDLNQHTILHASYTRPGG